jgi:hypothetical protein
VAFNKGQTGVYKGRAEGLAPAAETRREAGLLSKGDAARIDECNASIDGPGESALIGIPTRTAAAAGALLLASCQQVSAPLPPVSAAPQAQATIDDYLRKVDGRFGALALSQDGTRATY